MDQQMPHCRDRDSTSRFSRHVFSSGGSKNGNLTEPFFETNIMTSLKDPQKLEYYEQYCKAEAMTY